MRRIVLFGTWLPFVDIEDPRAEEPVPAPGPGA